MAAYDIDYYRTINDEEGPQAERLAEVLIWKYAPRSVIDIGCATGLYLKPFLDRGVEGYGVDRAPDAVADEVLQIPRELIEVADITKDSIRHKADLALCIEVVEHIPPELASAVIKHITETADRIFFSAAAPGQGGHDHINCQPKEYWQKLFEATGFERLTQDEDYIRIIMASGYHLGWLTNNLMIFERPA